MNSKKLNTTFYQNIAKIFYAIAKVDRIIKKKEIEALKKIVKDEWLQIDEDFDVFGTDTAYQIEIVFDWLQSKDATSENCYEDFIEYYHNHSSSFSKEIKKLIMSTSTKIASAFACKNKSELILLTKLRLEFNLLLLKH